MNTITERQTMTRFESNWILFWTFLKIGSTAFGGFMALISVVQNYLVDRKKLLTDTEILNGISLATILPGPVAVNVVAYAGYKINGGVGAAICAIAVILPSFLLILLLSHLYFTYGEMPAVSNIFKGFIPAVAAIIIAATFNMGKKTLVGAKEFSIATASLLALILVGGFYSTVLIIATSGAVGYFLLKDGIKKPKKKRASKTKSDEKVSFPKYIHAFLALPLVAMLLPFLNTGTAIIGKLFITFAGMSVLLFGGGFVFIPMIQEVVVDSYGWVTNKEFIDGIALGQITPGPILISATFIGYKIAGVLGAFAATVGIFLPPAMLMLVCAHFLDRLQSSVGINAALKGIRCGVIGMIAAAAIVVMQSADHNWITATIFLTALVSLIKFKIEVAWIIPVAGVTGYLLY